MTCQALISTIGFNSVDNASNSYYLLDRHKMTI
jgi:hypothetical protein